MKRPDPIWGVYLATAFAAYWWDWRPVVFVWAIMFLAAWVWRGEEA